MACPNHGIPMSLPIPPYLLAQISAEEEEVKLESWMGFLECLKGRKGDEVLDQLLLVFEEQIKDSAELIGELPGFGWVEASSAPHALGTALAHPAPMWACEGCMRGAHVALGLASV